MRTPDNSDAALAARALEAIRDGIIVTDRNATIVMVNAAFCRMTGFSGAEVVGKKPNVLQSGMHGKEFYRRMWAELLASGQWEGEIWNCKRNGEVFLEYIRISAILDATGEATHYAAVFSDITDKRMAERKLEWLANYDMLTGLPNRRLFHARLSASLREPESEREGKHLLFIDLDGFKWQNDKYGHALGDRLLRSAAERLKAEVGERGTVYRYGGDEFTVLLDPLPTGVRLEDWTNGLLAAFRKPLPVEDSEIVQPLSIGVAPLRELSSPADSDRFVRHADSSMYRAKKAGGDRWVLHEDGLLSPEEERARKVGELREALANGQLLLHYQPKFEVASKRLAGLEALVRWNHPQRGELAPGEFIPLAEETGLIAEIGEWVLGRAVAQLREWEDWGYEPVPVSVNLSPIELQREGLAGRIEGLLAKLGLPARLLELEVTESSMMRDIDPVLSNLTELRRLGVGIAIDDFGTGYSSLGQLARFPVDTIKIDKSFIQSSREDEPAPIVESIVNLAHGMKLKVVAEGVEDERQLRLLSRLHCELAQGFLFSRPLPAREIEERYWKKSAAR
ncbi:putative bifunctional diguanylate cyclase/phosphodiesterase [Cohnella fermenti]|uniref:EAL domain-containing protein n=1 Tax=Cohnella fermenti TaxID=2565925 RepID=A0A4S4BEU5_9BACL|nr:GGDEF domain-containing phosphodiesterase [Cohnella fermenti]THF72761.1 EAL domain-containing protein [Cohnella fermenti]